jgi:hypothetical protein
MPEDDKAVSGHREAVGLFVFFFIFVFISAGFARGHVPLKV